MLPTITGFTPLGQSVPGKVLCDALGTCFKVSMSDVSKMPPNGATFATIGDASTGLIGGTAGLAIDDKGDAFVSLCASGVFELASGAKQWTPLGTGLTGMNVSSCGNEAFAIDASGGLFLGVLGNDVWSLPSGQSTWASAGSGLAQAAIAMTTSLNGDLYVGASDAVYVRKKGGAAFAALPGSPKNAYHLSIDGAGAVYGVFAAGGDPKPPHADVYVLPAGMSAWTETTGLSYGDINGGGFTNVVLDDKSDAYIVGPDATTHAQSLYRLPAGASVWSKVLDIAGLLPQETCAPLGSIADDHLGHLIVQCQSTLLRSQP